MNEVRHPSRAAVLVSQNRAVSIARDVTTARANNDKYLDLVARTAADQHATVEITGWPARTSRIISWMSIRFDRPQSC